VRQIVATVRLKTRDLIGALFRDDLLASAAMDRLLHHAHVLEMTGRSYRTRGTDKLGGDEAA